MGNLTEDCARRFFTYLGGFLMCLECGNCRQNNSLFYCTEKNDFVVAAETEETIVKERTQTNWRKGTQEYEHQRRLRKEKSVPTKQK